MRRLFREVWYVLRAAYRDFGRDTGGVTAGAIAFYTALSLVPIALLALSITGHLLGHSGQARAEVAAVLRQLLPGAAGQQVLDAIAGYSVSGRLLPNIVAFLGLLWAGTNLFGVLSLILTSIWIGHRERGFLAQRAVGLLALLVAGLLFFANMLLTSAVAALQAHQQLRLIGPVLPFGTSALLAALTFFLLYRFLPRGHVSTRAALVAALPAAAFWLISRYPFSLLVSGSSAYGQLYGPLAGAVVLLLWIYYSAYIMVFCAELGAAAQARFWPKEVARPAEPG